MYAIKIMDKTVLKVSNSICAFAYYVYKSVNMTHTTSIHQGKPARSLTRPLIRILTNTQKKRQGMTNMLQSVQKEIAIMKKVLPLLYA